MKLFIAGFFHETMTFSKNKTNLGHFKERGYKSGQELYESEKGTRSAIGAFIDVGEKNNIELQFSLNASAVPSGIVTREVYDVVIEKVTRDLKECQDIDGILIDFHGAMVVEGIDDPESLFLKTLKELTDFKIPIMFVFDYHANIGSDTIKYSDGFVVYKTYPHIDMYETAHETINLMINTLENKINPKIAFRNIPLISPLLSQGTFCSPMKELIELAKSYYQKDKVLSVSLAPGFAYADIQENGFSVIATTDDDETLANKIVVEISEAIWEKRHQLICNPISIKDAIKEATSTNTSNGPVLLCDAADNPGGGSAGDGTDILRELLDQNISDALVSTIWDAESARELHQHKVGEMVKLNLGGKSPEHAGTSLDIEGKILSLKDGHYTNKGPFNTGSKANLGLTALIDINGIKVIVHENRAQTLDREIIRFTGINPEDQKIIVIKSTIHYRADFEPIASKVIEVNAPGPVCPNLKELDYKNIRRPSFPIDPDMAKPF
ncbi:MAG: hypothetical protein COA79_08195 [Planctomycetota bacterium]|nr:MAG: hypothetical protein COA79_08195 [Planctomycetota bacterium]